MLLACKRSRCSRNLWSMGALDRVVRRQSSRSSHTSAPWRPSLALDEWVQRDARPISLRQLTFFGRTLNESRLLSSANYVRTELPTRLAHRLRDMQTLPYVVLSNAHLSHAYALYSKAFELFRKVPEIKTLQDNDAYCSIVEQNLQEHQTVIPRLIMGVLEVRDYISPAVADDFVTTLLRSRISRRVIAEQHIALTKTFAAQSAQKPRHLEGDEQEVENVGEIFLRCNAKDVIEQCAAATLSAVRARRVRDCPVPEIRISGQVDATFPYILSHLQYIVGELLRNSVQATFERHGQTEAPGMSLPPIDVLIGETSQHVIMRFSDQGGGISKYILPYLWSFSKGPRRQTRLNNLTQVPRLSATMQELELPNDTADCGGKTNRSSLSSLTTRSPDLRLGIGLPMSRIYAEYWAGSLDLHGMEGYGADAFLQISKLGNKNEHISTRASMDAL